MKYKQIDLYPIITTIFFCCFLNSHAQTNYVVNFTETMDNIKVERTCSYLGTEKSSLIGKANLDREYLKTDFEKYLAEPLSKGKKKDDVAPITDTKYEYPDKEQQIKERKTLFEKGTEKRPGC